VMRISEQILQLSKWELVPICDAHPRMFGHIRCRDDTLVPPSWQTQEDRP
jgi:hypothetical protein